MSMVFMTIFIAATCMLTFSGALPSMEMSSPLEPSVAPMFLQTSATQQMQGRQGVPSDFFEDAQTVPVLKRTAPHDVGTESVPINQFETANLLQSLQAASNDNSYHRSPISLANTFTVSQGKQTTEQALQQQQHIVQPEVGTGMPGATEAEMLRQEEAQVEQQQQKLRERRLKLEQQLELQQQQAAAKVAMPSAVTTMSMSDPAKDATHFFESQGDIAGQEPDRLPVQAAASDGLSTVTGNDQASGIGSSLEEALSLVQHELPSTVPAAVEKAPAVNVDFGVTEKEQVSANNVNHRLQMNIGQQSQPADNDATMKVMLKQLQEQRQQLRLLENTLNSVNQVHNPQPSSIGGMFAQLPQSSQGMFAQLPQSSQGMFAQLPPAVKQQDPSMLLAGHQDFAPIHEHCSPQCSYNCSNPTCDEECHPVCQSPTCQTRCAGADLSSCRMNCGKPHCSVVCPKKPCTAEGCPECTTNCSKPMCMLQCPTTQPCENVCEHPQCTYQCKAPTSCPEPTCLLQCESPKNCIGSTYRQLPPLQPGEVLVQSFVAPSGLNTQIPEQHFAWTPQKLNFAKNMQPLSFLSLRGSNPTQLATPAPGPTMVVPVEGMLAQNKAGMMIEPQSQQWNVQMPVMMNTENR